MMKQISDLDLREMCAALDMDDNVTAGLFGVFDRIVLRGIVTFNQWAVFLGQCYHESAGFTVFEENLNYSKEAILRTWPTRFANNPSLLKQCTNNPERLANVVYGGRMGNSMSQGYLYRGRAIIQLTGLDNYILARDGLGLPLVDHPELAAEDLEVAWLVSAFYFTERQTKGVKLTEFAERLDHTMVTKLINGGSHGLKERIYATNLALAMGDATQDVFATILWRKGHTGKDIGNIQDVLKALGFYTGKIDRAFGPALEAAVKNFQTANGLVADGKIGGRTYRTLMESYVSNVVSR